MVISFNIEDNVKDILNHSNITEEMYHIEFGEDCFMIIFNEYRKEIFSDTIEQLKDCFNNEIVLIRVDEEGNLVLDFEIVWGTPSLYGKMPVLHKI